jgi:phosphonate transport system substrate-binding protein
VIRDLTVAAAVLGCTLVVGLTLAPEPPASRDPVVPRPPTTLNAAHPLRVAAVDLDPERAQQSLGRLARHLGAGLRTAGVDAVYAEVRSSLDEVIGGIRSGEIDVFIGSTLAVAKVCRGANARPILSGLDDSGEQRSIIFTTIDSGLRSVTDLPGRRLAFSEPYSTFSHLLPRARLVASGLALREVRADEDFDAREIGCTFSDDDESTLFWVLRGKVHAGVLGERRFNELRTPELVALDWTAALPPAAVAVRSSLDPELVEAIIESFVALGDSALRPGAMDGFEHVARFEPLGPDGFTDAFDLFDTVSAGLGR